MMVNVFYNFILLASLINLVNEYILKYAHAIRKYLRY